MENKEGCYLFPEDLTLFYLPHCPKQLLNNILWTNWEQLDQILIFGNSISGIVANLTQNQLESVIYIQRASKLCKGNILYNQGLYSSGFFRSALLFPLRRFGMSSVSKI